MVSFAKEEDPPHQGQPMMSSSGKTIKKQKMSRISSLNHVIANGDKTTEFLLKKKEQNFNYLTVKILKEQQQQNLAGLHFQASYDHLLFLPSIIITLFGGVLGILVKSTLVTSDKAQTWIALGIAVVSVLSVFIQSLTKQLNYGGRAGFHESASTALKKLYEYTELSSREAKYNSIYKALKTDTRVSVGANLTHVFAAADKEDSSVDGFIKEVENTDVNTAANAAPSPPDGGDAEKGDEKASSSQDSITSQFFQAVDGCNSVIPIYISQAFNMIDARVSLVNKSMLKDKKHSTVDWSEVLPSIYYQLTETILQYPCFPIRLPRPEWSVNKALKDFKKSLASGADNNADLISVLIERAEVIRESMPLLLDEDTDHDDTLV